MSEESQRAGETRVLISSTSLTAHGNSTISPPRFLRLTDPDKANASIYLLADGVLHECTAYRPRYASFFVDNFVIADGTVHFATPIDPLFLMLPGLESARGRNVFCDMEEITSCLGWTREEAAPVLDLLGKDGRQLQCVCDAKEAAGQRYFRLNEDKMIAWMALKVKSAKEALLYPGSPFEKMEESALMTYCLELVNEYVAPEKERNEKLAKELKISLTHMDGNGNDGGTGIVYDPDTILRNRCEGSDSKRPRIDPKAVAKAKAAELRAATKAAKLAKDASGMRKLSAFFKPTASTTKS